jgi:hypothetical protein
VGEDEAGLERTRLVSAPLDTWLKRHTLGLEVSRDKGEPLHLYIQASLSTGGNVKPTRTSPDVLNREGWKVSEAGRVG